MLSKHTPSSTPSDFPPPAKSDSQDSTGCALPLLLLPGGSITPRLPVLLSSLLLGLGKMPFGVAETMTWRLTPLSNRVFLFDNRKLSSKGADRPGGSITRGVFDNTGRPVHHAPKISGCLPVSSHPAGAQ